MGPLGENLRRTATRVPASGSTGGEDEARSTASPTHEGLVQLTPGPDTNGLGAR
jgi:hypothetical protein